MSVHAITWMSLKNIMLNQRSQPIKDHMGCDFLYMKFQNEQINVDETKRTGGCLLLGGNGLENGDRCQLEHFAFGVGRSEALKLIMVMAV